MSTQSEGLGIGSETRPDYSSTMTVLCLVENNSLGISTRKYAWL